MAWNVVIAGGGFAGASAARELERILPKQSARLILVNDVNFLLYTPFLPEAAAGTLEPRHVVTPLRDILKRTYLRLGAICGPRPGGAHGRAAHPRRARSRRSATTSSWSRSARSRARCRCRGSTEHAIGFKSLADAIWLRNHVIETLEDANATEDPARREELLTYVFVGGGYSGLEALAELQDFAADAMDRYPRARLHGMRWILVEAADRVLPEVTRGPRRLRAARAARARASTSGSEPGSRRRPPDSVLLSTGERIPTRTLVWTAGVAPHPSLASLNLPLDPSGRVQVDEHMRGRGPAGRLGDRRLRRRPAPGRRRATPARRPRAMAVRQGPAVAHNIAAELGVATRPRRFEYLGREAFVNLGRYKAVGKIGNLKFRGFPAWWMARTYHMSQVPGLVRKIRAIVDWTVGLPFSPRHRRGRLDRPPAPAARRGLRSRRHPPSPRLNPRHSGGLTS